MKTRDVFIKLMNYIGKYRFLLLVSILLAFATVALTLYVPILFGQAIDGIIAAGKVDFGLVSGVLTKILIIVLICSALTWIMNLINNRLTYRIGQDIRNKAIEHMQVLPLKYLDGHTIGDITDRIIADVDMICDGLLLGFTQLFSGVVTIVLTLVFMFSKSVHISLFVIALTPLSFFVAKFIAKHSYGMVSKQTASRGQLTGLTEEMVGSETVVKAFSHGKAASEDFRKINNELYDYTWRATFYSSLTNPSTRAVNSVIYAGVALFGAWLIIGGTLSVGGLSVLLNYANQYMKPFNDISSVVTELQNAFACAARVFEFIEAEPETKDAPGQLPAVKGQIDINEVFFAYDPAKPLIGHFNLHAKSGQSIAIVGPTGCGKTTFINLLMRFYDIDSGSICIDGTNIYDVTRASLRSSFGMVLQETWLQNGTVRDNIAFGKPEAADEEIIQAAKEAHSWEFIRRLPQGLDTVLKDDSLSAGQKQLLCITRVMLYDPPMLILDEATSSIDTRTEMEIQRAFDKLMQGRTSFVVAHRLSTIRNADIILVMKDGHIIEQGNHETLMAKNGFYTKLYNSQFAKV